jgi:hypothetical protein
MNATSYVRFLQTELERTQLAMLAAIDLIPLIDNMLESCKGSVDPWVVWTVS